MHYSVANGSGEIVVNAFTFIDDIMGKEIAVSTD